MTSTQRSLASMREALSKSQQRALQSIKAQPKSKVSLAKAPWDKKKEEKMNESNWPVYTRIKENRAMHTKGATEPEAIDSKASGMEKDFVNKHGGLKGNDSGIDGAKAAADTAKNATAGVKAGGNVNRPADQKTGDKNIVKSTEAK